MESQIYRSKDNDVKGSRSLKRSTAASSGRERQDPQVAPDRHPATVVNPKSVIKPTVIKPTVIKQKSNQRHKESCMRIGTWNVRTMYQAGKKKNLEREMKRMNVDILGVCEVRWTGIGTVKTEDNTFIYSGGEKAEKGVGLMIAKKHANSIIGYWAVSDRILLVKLKGKPNINIIQTYAPTSDSTEEELDEFYDQLDEARRQCKNHEIVIVMGDMNAKVGNAEVEDIVGPFGLGVTNERGERWIEWCKEYKQMIANTWFRHHPRRLWTWSSPGDRFRNQIDYITINTRFRNSAIQTKTHPGADCDSDHNPVITTLRLKLKNFKKKKRAKTTVQNVERDKHPRTI